MDFSGFMALHQTAKCGNFEAGRTVEGSSLYPNFPHEQPPFPAGLLFGANVSVSIRQSTIIRTPEAERREPSGECLATIYPDNPRSKQSQDAARFLNNHSTTTPTASPRSCRSVNS
jgi:hypothetical protein